MRSFEEGAFEHFVNKLKDNLGLKADKTYVDGKVKTNVPASAKFTDTVTYINGRTGIINKADIVALGIQAQGEDLRIGNFKFVFNEVENSLDVEVLA
ncbi:MAG TPA: hypothetical protein VFC79_05890 [Tissierellaceae bacterium]|nr:hypothetical protein [Tissierellaceae bacterium]